MNETIIPEEVVHVLGSFNVISLTQILEKDVKVKLFGHYVLNYNKRHVTLIATAPQVDGLFCLHFMSELIKCTNFNGGSGLVGVNMAGYALWYNTEKQILWRHHLAHDNLKILVMLATISNALSVMVMFNCESCLMCKYSQNHLTSKTTFCGTEQLFQVNSKMSSSFGSAITAGPYIRLSTESFWWYVHEYILMYMSEALEMLKVGMAIAEKN